MLTFRSTAQADSDNLAAFTEMKVYSVADNCTLDKPCELNVAPGKRFHVRAWGGGGGGSAVASAPRCAGGGAGCAAISGGPGGTGVVPAHGGFTRAGNPGALSNNPSRAMGGVAIIDGALPLPGSSFGSLLPSTGGEGDDAAPGQLAIVW